MPWAHPKSVEQHKEKVREQFLKATKEIQTFIVTCLKPIQLTSNGKRLKDAPEVQEEKASILKNQT